MRDALVAGLHFDIFHRHARRIAMANIAQTVNVLQAMVLTDGDRLVLTPTYHVFEMNKGHQDAVQLSSHVIEAPSTEVEGEPLPLLSMSASTKDGGALLSLTHLSVDEELDVRVDLRGREARVRRARVLTGDTVGAFNEPDTSGRVTPQSFATTLEDGVLGVRMPPTPSRPSNSSWCDRSSVRRRFAELRPRSLLGRHPQIGGREMTNTPEWNDPAVYEWGTEPAHASLMPYETHAQALHADRLDSPYRLSLDGGWKFHWSENPAARMPRLRRRAASMTRIGTRSRSRLAGSCTATTFPSGRTPSCRGPGPMGTTNSPIPPATTRTPRPRTTRWASTARPSSCRWDGPPRRTFIQFDGVESAYYVWINGQKVGYREDSYTSGEFDITAHLRPGRNLIAVEVYRWCTGSYLENQDNVRLSGIFRSVLPDLQIAGADSRLHGPHSAGRPIRRRRARGHCGHPRLRRRKHRAGLQRPGPALRRNSAAGTRGLGRSRPCAARRCRCRFLRGPVGAGSAAASVVGRTPGPLHSRPRAVRRGWIRCRTCLHTRRLPTSRSHRRRLPPQRPAAVHPRCQPSRMEPADRAHSHQRGHDRRHPADETVEHQRRTHLALPERSPLVRTRRRVRTVHLRRGRQRNPHQPHRRSRKAQHPRRPSGTAGAAGVADAEPGRS